MNEAKHTTDHKTIQRRAERRGGHPATVASTANKGEHAGILRIDFDPKDDKLDRISWEDFFEKFDDEKLEFLYQDKTADGGTSRFHKFVQRGSKH